MQIGCGRDVGIWEELGGCLEPGWGFADHLEKPSRFFLLFPSFQVKGLSDELQGQIRQVPKSDEARGDWLDVFCWGVGFFWRCFFGNVWNC